MQIKTIKKILNKKLSAWADSITDEKVRSLVRKNSIVTGGSIVSMLLNEEVNDFDIYFKNKETTKAVSEYYVKKTGDSDLEVLDGNDWQNSDFSDKDFLKQRDLAIKNLDKDRIRIFIPNQGFYKNILSEEEKDQGKFEIAFISPNAITLTDQLQIVVRFYGAADEIHKNYDFIHATNYYDFANDELVTNKEALESILTKQLKYSGSLYPVTSVIRTKKFIKRGWNIGAAEYLKMSFQISALDLTDPAVLEEQLMGVDVAYFAILIETLTEMRNKNPDFCPSYQWIQTIIEKIFDGSEG